MRAANHKEKTAASQFSYSYKIHVVFNWIVIKYAYSLYIYIQYIFFLKSNDIICSAKVKYYNKTKEQQLCAKDTKLACQTIFPLPPSHKIYCCTVSRYRGQWFWHSWDFVKNLGQYWKFLNIIRFWDSEFSYEFLKGSITTFMVTNCAPVNFSKECYLKPLMFRHHSRTFLVIWYRKQVK